MYRNEWIKTWFLVAIMFALIIFGCKYMAEKSYQKSYPLTGWTLVYADSKTVNVLCKKDTKGCLIESMKWIVCEENDLEVCGHELKHIAQGDWHK